MSEFAAEIVLRKPIVPGIIDLADGTAGYVRYRTWILWYDDTISDLSIGSTTQPGGGGQIQILGYDPVNHTVEGIQNNVVFSYNTGYNTPLNNCDFIGHW